MSKIDGMTNKQRRFCQEYLIDLNATQACIRAGYSKKSAGVIGVENLIKPIIKNYIDMMMQKKEDSLIMSAAEVLKALTASARGQTTETVIVTVGTGDGCSEAQTITKTISERDRLKALELIGKRHALFTDKVNVEGSMVVFNGEDDLKD